MRAGQYVQANPSPLPTASQHSWVLCAPSRHSFCKAADSIAVPPGLNIRALLPISLDRLIKILAILALSLCLPAMAQDQNGWQFDSLRADSTVSKTDAQQIYEVLLKMVDRWNAHDIEGYLEVYWKSPELLVIVDSEQFNGWQQLHDSYANGYPDRNSMGFIQPSVSRSKSLSQT